MEAIQGTYVLMFSCKLPASMTVGRLGLISLNSGYYAYVGSAFGPGGIKSRVGRHVEKSKINKWHIDYVRNYMELTEVWFTYHKDKVECDWARVLTSLGGVCPVKKLGSSDCRCESHFFRYDEVLSFDSFNSCVEQIVFKKKY